MKSTAPTHELKCWPGPFEAVWNGIKRYEIRKADRNFALGDELRLREWQPVHEGDCQWHSDLDEQQTERSDFRCKLCKRGKDDALAGTYTRRELFAEVVYLTKPGEWGLPDNLCVMSLNLMIRKELGPSD